MAERRMFSKTIIDSDLFLDMPLSTQLLYFHLGMRADDDGFVNNPRKIQRSIGCNDDDMRMLIAKRFIMVFESGVIVIRHWRSHNYIRNDRYKKTACIAELNTLGVDENGVYYSSGIPNGDQMDTTGIPNGDQMATDGRHRLELGEDSIVQENISPSTDVDAKPRHSINYQQIVDSFNRVCVSLPKVQTISDRRKKAIRAATQTVENFGGWEKLFQTVERSDFLTGRSGAWTGCAFDWIIKPANITKIIEGNFKNGRKAKTSQAHDFSDPANYKEQNIDYEKIFRN